MHTELRRINPRKDQGKETESGVNEKLLTMKEKMDTQ